MLLRLLPGILALFVSFSSAWAEFVYISNDNVMAAVDDLSGRFIMATTGPRGTVKTRQILQEKMPPTSVTAVKIDNLQTTYGSYDGNFSKRPSLMNPEIIVSEWKCRGVTFMQVVQIVRGNFTGRKDTVRISYLVFNFSGGERKVGVELLLDTYMGEKDDVHYTLPSGAEVKTESEFSGAALPDFWYAQDNAGKPTLAILSTLKHPMLVTPDRLVLGSWKKMFDELFDTTADGDRFEGGYDSAAAIFYEPRVVADEGSTFFSTMFGLYETNRVAGSAVSISLTAPAVATEKKFEVFADIVDISGKGAKNVPVRLTLPENLQLSRESRIPGNWVIPEIKPGSSFRVEYKVEQADSVSERTEAIVTFEVDQENGEKPVRYDRRIVLDPKGTSIQADIVTRVMENLEDKTINLSNETILQDKSVMETLVVAQAEVKSNDTAVEISIALETNTNRAVEFAVAPVETNTNFAPETNIVVTLPETNQVATPAVITNTVTVYAQWKLPESRVDFGAVTVGANGKLTADQQLLLDEAVKAIRREAVGRRIEVVGKSEGNDQARIREAGLLAESVYAYLVSTGKLPAFKLVVRVESAASAEKSVVGLRAEMKESKE